VGPACRSPAPVGRLQPPDREGQWVTLVLIEQIILNLSLSAILSQETTMHVAAVGWTPVHTPDVQVWRGLITDGPTPGQKLTVKEEKSLVTVY
jgi:hypothetical protein